MNKFLVERNGFERFFIQNFESLLKDDKYIVEYKYDDLLSVIRYYRKHFREGITLRNAVEGGESEILYTAFVMHNDLKLEQIPNIMRLIENQNKFIGDF